MSEKMDANSPNSSFRSPHLMSPHNSAVVVIDVQEKLLPHIPNHQRLSWNIGRLLTGAKTLGVRAVATEQYPKGLGGTVSSLTEPFADLLGEIPDKSMFSCRECQPLFNKLSNEGVHNLLLCGIETHVCVAQSALDLMSLGFNVFICLDAIGARFEVDHQTAIQRLETCGVIPTTTEAALFEWCEKAGSDEFKTISKLVQQSAPTV
ncbi:MAG: isochorismatase family protein [Mariniblastus sp.]